MSAIIMSALSRIFSLPKTHEEFHQKEILSIALEKLNQFDPKNEEVYTNIKNSISELKQFNEIPDEYFLIAEKISSFTSGILKNFLKDYDKAGEIILIKDDLSSIYIDVFHHYLKKEDLEKCFNIAKTASNCNDEMFIEIADYYLKKDQYDPILKVLEEVSSSTIKDICLRKATNGLIDNGKPEIALLFTKKISNSYDKDTLFIKIADYYLKKEQYDLILKILVEVSSSIRKDIFLNKATNDLIDS